MRTNGNKIVALILGILVSLFVLEISLRIIGVRYSNEVPDGNAVKREPGAFVILCLGDSFTYGSGAPEGRGYPAQLVELLQKKYPGMKVRVVNGSVGGYNTAMILGKFDEDVDKVNPDVIIVLAGGANRWNAYGYGDYQKKQGLINRLDNWFYEIKIFKLVRLFMFDLQNKKEHLSDTYVFPAEMKMPPDAEEWRVRGRACERDGKYDEAISWYKKIVEKYPSAFGGYDCLRNTYYMTGNKEGERRMFKKLIELDPESLKFLIKMRTHFLADPENDKEDLEFIKRYEHANPIAADIVKKVMGREKYHQETRAWINHDIEEMVRRARRRGIEVILQDYPDYDNGDRYDNHSFINEGLRQTAGKNAVLFIDNERLFNQMFLKGENRDNYFEPAKVHCNEKGYGVMAKNIYCGIVASNGLGILPDVDPAEKDECFGPRLNGA